MDPSDIQDPVCLSHYFTNKQNVRSFGNIIKLNNLKKSTEEAFYKHLFDDDENMVSDLTLEFTNILSTIKTKLLKKSKKDFKEYFHQAEDSSFLQPVDKEYVFTNCWQAVNDILPRNFFGCKQNTKVFKNFLHAVVYSMKRQHFMAGKLLEKWDIAVVPWKDITNVRTKVYKTVLWTFKCILVPMICLNFYVTTCKLDSHENKLYYFWKSHWQSFYDTQLSKMIFTKVINKSQQHSIGKKSKRNHSLANRANLRILIKDIPKLHLSLKPNNNCRPIVCYKNNTLTVSEKYKIKDNLKFLTSLCGKPAVKIENRYNSLYCRWINANKPKLFFIKTDLSNAFGLINREKLAKILLERYTAFLKAESCLYKKKRIAQQYKELITELRKPILIRAGSAVYEWREGLVQGYKYSPALSELYYSYLDSKYFSEHMKNNETDMKLFTRVVDDYLYITDSLEDAMSFLDALSNYRNVNLDKTIVNFPHDSIKFSEDITFLGYHYNTNNMQVSRASNIYAGQMCYKIAFTSGLSDLPKFIESRIGRSGIQIRGHIFNLHYNNEDLIWRHIFTTFCLSANKFCTILAVLCEDKDMKGLLPLYKKRVAVKMSTALLDTIKKNKPADYMFVYCINHLRYLSWQALFLCAKLTPKCSGLVPLITVELAKSNCIFGKWRDHACRIDTNGECQRKAIKEVCRRLDLRMIFRDFEKLPNVFECYHHRRLK